MTRVWNCNPEYRFTQMKTITILESERMPMRCKIDKTCLVYLFTLT